jgi:DNA-binding NarL/FixJ family response regulator
LRLVLASGLSSDAAANPGEGELRHARRAGAITNGGGETTSPGETLTAREIQVLQLMAQGLPNKIIAARLGISLHTAKFHVASILSKLGAASRTEAVTLGARHGFVAL